MRPKYGGRQMGGREAEARSESCWFYAGSQVTRPAEIDRQFCSGSAHAMQFRTLSDPPRRGRSVQRSGIK
jgi:hypothetical protein